MEKMIVTMSAISHVYFLGLQIFSLKTKYKKETKIVIAVSIKLLIYFVFIN